MKLFEHQEPQSEFVVYCLDYSQEALQGLRGHKLPDWLELKTHQVEVNSMTSDDLADADLILLYGILEYVEDRNLNNVFKCARDALNPGGYLVLVTLVQGEGALDIEGEIIRSADEYLQHLQALEDLVFVDYLKVTMKPDRHDLGKGYPGDHLHYVCRWVMMKAN